MVAQNTQVFPLQHHLKGSNASTSFRNYGRIQSEMQRDGFEVHKENLLTLSLSKKAKHSGAGEKPDAIAPLGSQRAQVTSVKTGLLSNVQETEHGTHQAGLRFSDMFPGAFTTVSTCTPASDINGEHEFCPSKPVTAEHVEIVQFLPDVKNVEDSQEDNAKRLRFTSMKGNTSIELFDKQTSKQANSSCCVVNGTCMSAARDGAIQAGMGNTCSFICAYQSDNYAVAKPTPQHSPYGFNAGFPSNMSWVSSANECSACGTSPSVELSKALPTVGLKLFTTSAHAQMPKALLTFSEGEPSLPLSLEHTQQQASNRLQRISTPMHENSCTETDWGKFLALSATPVANETETASARILPFQQRFKQLQAFLKRRDEADQNECMQALRSLSAASRSGHAVELETRAIRLSLEEGKEIKRMRLLNVLGKISERSFDDAGATPHGPRLPAPGATTKLRSVP